MIRALIALALLLASATAEPRCYACSHRSAQAKAEFRREHPCPATGLTRGLCAGFVIDHVTPLCAGGRDASSNMAWQDVAAAKAKDREERRMCR